MADLSEYLGHLLCEITRARVMADREALRVAAEYAAEESGLLRHFPVPRMRLPDLEITVPVVVNEIPDGHPEITSLPERLGKRLAEAFGSLPEKKPAPHSAAELTRLVVESLASLPRKPTGISVDGTTANVKKAGNTAFLMNIKLIIKEESMEMALEPAAQGQTTARVSRLTPE